jgi:hypothetical protein
MKVKIDSNAQLQQLAHAMVKQALRDLKASNPVQAVDALLWLTGPDFGIWAEVWGVPFADSWQMLISGAERKFREPRENHARVRPAENV